MRRYPNRTGGLGEISGGSITLTGTALPGMRSFADAVTAGKLAAGQLVGLAVRAVADPNAWITCTALYHSTGRLDIGAIEDASTTALANEAVVEVVACVTDAMLSLLDGGDPIYWDGPAYWTPEGTPASIAWDTDHWSLTGEDDSGSLAVTEWATGFDPASVSLDVFVPAAAVLVEAQACGIIVFAASGSPAMVYTPMSTVALGWNRLTINLSALSDDLTRIVFDLSSATTLRTDYQFRRIEFAE